MTEVGLPYNILDGTVNDAVQVMANFNALKSAVEALSSVAAPTDGYQAGVLTSTDWVPGAGSVNSGTGAITLTTFGGVAWLPGAVSGIVRTSTAAGTVGPLAPPKLPLASGFISVGVELTQNLGAAAVSLVSGVEQASEAEALAHPAATTAGKMRVRDIILKNTAGVYSIVKERDRRPWARGAFWSTNVTAGNYATAGTVFSALDTTRLQARLECAGGPLLMQVSARIDTAAFAGALGSLAPFLDGVVPAVAGTGDLQLVESIGAATQPGGSAFSWVLAPAAGSRLVSLAARHAVNPATVYASAAAPLTMTLRELVTPSANNGIS